MIRHLKLFWKFAILGLMVPISIAIIAGTALNKMDILKYEYDNLYGFMLIPLLDVDKGNLYRERLKYKLREFTLPGQSPEERAATASAIRQEDKNMTDFIARYESEWQTTLSPELTAALAALGQQHLQTIEAEALAQFHEIYKVYAPKRDALLSGKKVSFKDIESEIEQMEVTFDSLVKVNRQFADYSNESAQNAIAEMRERLIFWSILLTLVAFIMIFWLKSIVVVPMVRLSEATRHLAEGKLDIKLATESSDLSQDEIGEIGRAFSILSRYFKEVIKDIVRISQGLAEGNLHIKPQAEYKGDFIQIKEALETLQSNQGKVIKDIIQLVSGNQAVTAKAEYQGDFVQIKNALETASINNAAQHWLQAGQTQLNERMRGEQEIETLAKNIISFLTPYVEAEVGLFYLLKETEESPPYLEMIASYAYTNPSNQPTKFLLGKGLVGEAADTQKTIFRTYTPAERTYILQSNLVTTLPHHVQLIPVLYEKTVKGVIEMGFSEKPTKHQQDFLEQVMQSIGIAVNTAQSRTRMQVLLTQVQNNN